MRRWISCSLALFLSATLGAACSGTASGPNRAPVADAGPDRVSTADEAVVLDGSGSYDPDGDTLTYSWELIHVPAGGTAGLMDADQAQAHLSPDASGIWLVRLVVSDGKQSSEPDVVQVRYGGCQSDSDCDDSVDCTTDRCQDGFCAHQPDDGACDDGAFCNGAEVCDPEAGCQPAVAAGCDDGIDCTADSCDEDTDSCSHSADDAACDDGLFCNGSETCDEAQGCLSDPAAVCDDGVDCTEDSCDEDADTCDHAPSDALCDDDLVCNGAESCDQINGCQPGVALACDDGVGCTIDSCSEAAGGCSFVADDSACDDGSFCNGPEICDPENGCQRQDPPLCDDGVACTDDSCDDASGGCQFVPNDNNCDDGNDCTIGSCDPQAGCQFPAGNESMACNQNNCSGTCASGVCTPCACNSDADCDDGFPCTLDTCNNGACSYTTDDTVCDNGLYCDGAETCVIGQGCQDGQDVVCDDGVGCTDDSCDEDADGCAYVANDDNCANGNACDGDETCDEVNDCQAGVAVDCDDGVGCTEDTCNPVDGQCSHTPHDTACDNGAFCDGDETCDPDNGCQAGTPPCPDAQACTIDACDEDGDSCSNTPSNAACDDGFMCNGSETCDAQTGCQAGTALADGVPCDEAAGDDGDECNSSCQAGACVAVAPSCPDDGLACNGAEACQTGLGCVSAGGVADGTACDEGAGQNNNPCDSSCQSGVCQTVPASAGQTCDDGVACTTGDACSGGACAGTPDDTYCAALEVGAVCRPNCFAASNGCGLPPAAVDVVCTDNPVDLGQTDSSTCQLDAGQAGQAACLSCTVESGLVVVDSTPFTGCDPNGWGLVSGTACFDSYNGCSPGNLNQDCCADLATLCDSLDGNDFLVTDKATNCGGGVEEWRLEKVFDFSDLSDVEICFDIADRNADNNQVIALWGQDLSDTNDPVAVELFCQNNGPRDQTDDTPYRFCVDLSAAAPWVDDNPTVLLQFVAHSENNGRIMALDNIRVTGWQNRCPKDVVEMVLADFDGCPATLPASWEGWTIGGTIVCNASNFNCYDASTRAIVENGTATGSTLTRTVDASALEADVTLCFFYGDDKGDQVRGLTVEFDTGSGFQTAWSHSGNQGPDKTCAEVCVNLSQIDPAANRNPALGLRFTMMSTKDPIHLDHITLSGADNCPVSGEVVLGAISDLGGGAYSFTAQDAVAEQLDADIQCNWDGLVDGGEVVAYRNLVENFGARRKLIFDNSGQGEALPDFPVLVVLDSAWFDYGMTKADGSDLMFIDADLVTVLPYEIERWNPAGTSYIWVRVPSITAASNTDYMWMYYGDPDADIAQDPAAVWSDYTAVWHLDENTTDEQTSGQHLDATGHGNTGAQGGNQAAAGRIGGGQYFDGVDDRITVPNTGLQISGQAVTIEAWARYDWDGNYSNIWRHVLAAGSNGHFWQLWFNTYDDGWRGRLLAESGYTDIFTTAGSEGTWAYLALRYDGAAVRLFLNASEIGSDAASGGLSPLDSDLWIGDNPGINDGNERMFSGAIDEVRIRESVLSADWLAAQHLSMTDAFITFGPEEPL